MHIGIVCEEYPPEVHGGTGTSYRDLAEGLAAHGHRVTVFGVRSSPELLPSSGCEERGVRVFRLPRTPAWWHYRLRFWWEHHDLNRRIRQVHRSTPLDVIECSDYHGWLAETKLAKVSTIVRIRGSNFFFDRELGRPPSAIVHRIERKCLARATHLAAVSRYAGNRTLEIAELSDRKCTVIHNGVDTARFAPGDPTKIEPGLVVFVNSLNPKKGIEELIDAANLVFPSRPSARLVVIGHDTQHRLGGAYLRSLKDKVRPDLRDRVVFAGRMDNQDVIPWLQRAAVCCYPSHMETFGIAALEAMSTGRPVIFMRCGPGPELIEDGVSGLLCDPHDPASIADSLARMLDHPAEAEAMGQRARDRAMQHFEKSAWISRNVEFFRSCLA